MKPKRNQTRTGRLLSTFLTVCLIVSLMPAAAFAEADGPPADQMVYLALGDSISAGYGLNGQEVNKDGEENFVNQVALGLERIWYITKLSMEIQPQASWPRLEPEAWMKRLKQQT